MSIQDKINNAKTSDWLIKDISKWKFKLIKFWVVFKAKRKVGKNDKRRSISKN